MPVPTTYPGVYVQEIPSGVRTITGVSTSITVFLAQAIWGPVNDPVLCLNYSDFTRTFTTDTSVSDLARAVRLFFLNGGTQCYVMRVANAAAVKANWVFNDSAAAATLTITAKSEGLLGNAVVVDIAQPDAAPLFDLTISLVPTAAMKDVILPDSVKYTKLTMNPADERYVLKIVDFPWVTLSVPAPPNNNRPAAIAARALSGGADSGVLVAADYTAAYVKLDKAVDLYNMMVLPKNVTGPAPTSLYGEASGVCAGRRAFLLMDPPDNWASVQNVLNPGIGITTLRVGLTKQYSAIFFPKLTLNEKSGPYQIGPSGAIAGLMARIDSSRGVWKAAAGTEADLRGITGLQWRFTDGENGFMNQQAVNVLRIFPDGIVSWGARTMDGYDDAASEYKYIPVRRTALYIEESLFRGLKWVVFEPNDEPLWAQIRLNVGAFMHDLFRQGAFQGKTKQDAYFVKCDSETTTQNDINKGIVNILVGFAPLKPAEFVILTLQQMTGQIQV